MKGGSSTLTVKELFNCMNTDVPRILIYDYEDNVIYEKHSSTPIGKLKYWDSIVAWIYRADSTEIALRLERGN